MSYLEKKIELGRSGLITSRIGIASSFGVGADGIEMAYDNGINYFYWGSLRTGKMGEGLRRIAKKDREGIVIVLQSYTRLGSTLEGSIERGLKKLGLEYADVLLLGMFYRKPATSILDAARRLHERGLIKSYALSTHKRSLIPVLEKEDLFEIFHVRYNAVHRGGERDLFPHMENNPGIVVFTATDHAKLLKQKNMPKGEQPPAAHDCYRFVLANPAVHVCMAGPRSTEDVRELIDGLEKGPLTEDEMDRMRRIGDHIYKPTRNLTRLFTSNK